MLIKIHTLILALLLTLAPTSNTKAKPPKYYQLPLKQLQSLANSTNSKTHTIILAQSDLKKDKKTPKEEALDREVKKAKKKKEKEEEEAKKAAMKKAKEDARKRNSKKSNSNSGNIFVGNWGSSGGGKEAAVIIFAIVGLSLVIAWIPYFPALLVEASRDSDDIEYLNIFSLQVSGVVTESKTSEGTNNSRVSSVRKGSFSGARYSFLMNRKSDPHILHKGLSGEFGYYYLFDHDRDTFVERSMNGLYWMIGPALAYKSGGFIFKIDLLAGTSIGNDLGLTTKAELGLQFGITKNFFVGLGLGGFYIDVNDNRGLISEANDIGLTYFGTMSFVF